MKNDFIFRHFNLQLFAEGSADGSTGADGATGVTASAAVMQAGAKKGVKNSLSNVKYGIQDNDDNTQAQAANVQQQTDTSDKSAEFEKLIKGEFKEIYDARMQDTIQKRLKNTKDTVEKYEALLPILEMLSNKYGVDSSDIQALNKAIMDDDAYYEQEALEKGVTVEQLKEIRKMERENAELKRQMKEQDTEERAKKLYSSWMEQSQQTKAVYPTFDLQTEMQNPKFIDLLRANVDVRSAYEVIHKDEILPAAMQFTAKTVERKLTNKIMANGVRPAENGISSQSATLVKSDVSLLTKEDRAEILRRVARGEKIKF